MKNELKKLIEQDKPVDFINKIKETLNQQRDQVIAREIKSLVEGTFTNPGHTVGETQMVNYALSNIKKFNADGTEEVPEQAVAVTEDSDEDDDDNNDEETQVSEGSEKNKERVKNREFFKKMDEPKKINEKNLSKMVDKAEKKLLTPKIDKKAIVPIKTKVSK